MSELDGVQLVFDGKGVAHALAMTQSERGRAIRFVTWCGIAIKVGEDASWTDDCQECERALMAWRGRQDAAREAQERRERAIESARKAAEMARRRRNPNGGDPDEGT